jgi:hypothetical protein
MVMFPSCSWDFVALLRLVSVASAFIESKRHSKASASANRPLATQIFRKMGEILGFW